MERSIFRSTTTAGLLAEIHQRELLRAAAPRTRDSSHVSPTALLELRLPSLSGLARGIWAGLRRATLGPVPGRECA